MRQPSAKQPMGATCCTAFCESQTHEDIALIPLLLEAAAASSTGSNRYSFTEIGAFDGFTESQTWLLDKCFGWHGVLIEASPQNFTCVQRTAANTQSRCTRLHATAQGRSPFWAAVAPSQVLPMTLRGRLRRSGATCHERCCGMLQVGGSCRPLPSIIADAGFPRTFLRWMWRAAKSACLHHRLAAWYRPWHFPSTL